MMAGNALLSAVRIGLSAFGMSTAGRSCTRWISVLSTILNSTLKIFIHVQLPGHKGTVTAVDFHPKEPISKRLFLLAWIA